MNIFFIKSKKLPISPYSQDAQDGFYKKITEIKIDRPAVKKEKVKKGSWRKKVKIILLIVFFILIILSGYIIYNLYTLKKSAIVQNSSGFSPILRTKNSQDLALEAVSRDGDARINILILGKGGKNHKGGALTDSIQILSIDPFNKTAGIISLPRDLYIKIEKNNYRKINEAYQIGEKQENNGGGSLVKEIVSNILDLKIHYFVNIDFDGFKEVVDSLGGITVNVSKAINDPLFPDKELEGYEPFYLKAGVQKITGEIALKYARSRETTSDFDRSRRQQELMVAIKEKALSLGVLASPTKVNNLIKVIGSHLKTDIQVQEMQELAKRYQELDSKNIQSLVISNSSKGPLVDSAQFGSYCLIPKEGLNKYGTIQNLAHSIIADPKVIAEAATIDVSYIKARQQDAKILIDRLTSYGYKVTDNGVLIGKERDDLLIIRTEKAPFSVKYLTNRLVGFKKKAEKSSPKLTDISISLQGKTTKN